jgi:ABC-type multidrug transport system fused ATPase/permease subunit
MYYLSTSKISFQKRMNEASHKQAQVLFDGCSYAVPVLVPTAAATGHAGGKGKLVKQQKQILKDITGTFSPGRLVAIMGASGAGKTSFLNFLAYVFLVNWMGRRLIYDIQEVRYGWTRDTT